jgi:hypothetical protein
MAGVTKTRRLIGHVIAEQSKDLEMHRTLRFATSYLAHVDRQCGLITVLLISICLFSQIVLVFISPWTVPPIARQPILQGIQLLQLVFLEVSNLSHIHQQLQYPTPCPPNSCRLPQALQ